MRGVRAAREALAMVLLSLTASWAGSREVTAQTLPDLIPTAIAAPTSAFVGDSITVTVSFRNGGGTTAPAPWSATIYLSPDTIITRTDRTLGFAGVAASLAAGASSSTTVRVPIDSTTTTGAWYLGTILDAGGRISESSETNNTLRAGVVTLLPRIDLRCSAISAGTSVAQGQAFAVGAALENIGSAPVAAGWVVSWYLSIDTAWSGADSLLGSATGGSLAAGATATLTGSFPAIVPEGSYFVISRVDATGLVPEVNEANNTRIKPLKVSITAPTAPTAPPPPPPGTDLVLSSVTLSGSAVSPMMYVGQARRDSVKVTVGVTNPGASSAAGGWTIGIVQDLPNGSHPLLQRVTYSSPLAGGGTSGTVSTWIQPVVDPQANLMSGIPTYIHVTAALDDGAIVSETNEANNTGSAQIEVTNGPDLVPVSLTADRPLVEGSPANVALVIANNSGIHTAPRPWAYWIALVPLSGSGSVKQVGVFPMDSMVQPTRPVTVTWPITVPPVPFGQYGLRVVLDTLGAIRIPEDYDGPQGEANNTLTTGPLLTARGPDLVVSGITIGKWNSTLDSATVSYTFKNLGPRDAAGPAMTGSPITFSVCGSNDGVTPWTSSCGGGVLQPADLPAGASKTVTENLWINKGDSFYLIVTVDSKNVVIEENEQDNWLVSSTKLRRP